MLPQVNATVVSVSRGGFSEDYTRAGSSDAPIWQGEADGYIQRKIVSTFNPNGALERVLQVTLIVDDLPIALEAGDIVVYQAGNPDNPQTLAGKLQTGTDPAYLPMLPDYYKWALEEVDAPLPSNDDS